MMKIEDQAALGALLDNTKLIEPDHDLCALFKVAKDAATAEQAKETSTTTPWVDDGHEVPRIRDPLPALRRAAGVAVRKHIDSADQGV